jgi:hypothetical protein
MKKLTIGALVAAQLASVAPAGAAQLLDSAGASSTRVGGFAGARLRISLDPKPRERVRAGLTIAPTSLSLRADGATRFRTGEGVEYGVSDLSKPELSLSGRRVSELVQSGRGPGGERRNLSTTGLVAIGVGVVLVGAGLLYAHELSKSVGH